MSERILAIIPALNAERTLPRIVAQTRGHIEPVIVIDDDSSDATGEVARADGRFERAEPFFRSRGCGGHGGIMMPGMPPSKQEDAPWPS